MIASSHNERQLIERFIEALSELPEVEAGLGNSESASQQSESNQDTQVDLHIASQSFILQIKAKKTVFPRDARQLIWQFREASLCRSKRRAEDSLSVLVAESISPGAKELLKSERVGFYDSGGSLYLPAPGAYLYIDKPASKTLAKSARALFSGRRSQVLHALLVRHQEWFGVKDLAKLAMVSAATTSQVLAELERFEWLETRGQGPGKERHLREPAALLDAWTKQIAAMSAPTLSRYYVPAIKADKLAIKVADIFEQHNVEYAISHELAAQLQTPFLSNITQVRAVVLAGADTEAAIKALGARVVNEGSNLAIIEAKYQGELLFRERVGDLWLASPIQTYLDLLRGEGRSKEMAEHFRKERIGF